MREHVIHEIIKRLVDSRLTCPVPINNLLDQAFLKHLNAYDGCKLCLGTGIFSMKTSQFNCSKISTITHVIGDAIKALWCDPGIKAVWQRRSEYHIIETILTLSSNRITFQVKTI